jgi:hypothetical protein
MQQLANPSNNSISLLGRAVHLFQFAQLCGNFEFAKFSDCVQQVSFALMFCLAYQRACKAFPVPFVSMLACRCLRTSRSKSRKTFKLPRQWDQRHRRYTINISPPWEFLGIVLVRRFKNSHNRDLGMNACKKILIVQCRIVVSGFSNGITMRSLHDILSTLTTEVLVLMTRPQLAKR